MNKPLLGNSMGVLFSQQRLCRIVLWLVSALAVFSSAWAENRDGSAVQVEITPTASFTLLREVTVLPVRFADGRPAVALTEALISALDATLKYTLKQADSVVQIPPTTADPVEAMEAASRRFAMENRLQAVIGGVLVPETMAAPGKVNTGSGQHRLILYLIDVAKTQPVWTLVFRLDASEKQFVQAPVQQAVDALLSALVQHGDIFTTRLSAPKILSRKMVAGRTRVVLLGRQQAEIVAYRLLRAEALDGRFVPVGGDVANTRHSLVIEDDRTPPSLPGWYIVVGINSRGLASVPEPPFYIADDRAAVPIP